MDKLKVQAHYFIEQVRNGVVIAKREIYNLIPTAGLNHILDVVFGAAAPLTQIDPWYIGLINNTPTPTLLAADTLASHTGWTEFATYTGNRQAWVDTDSAAGVKATTTVATFPITAACTLYGAFLCSAASGTSGTLISEGAFDDTIDLENGDDLKIRINITATSV